MVETSQKIVVDNNINNSLFIISHMKMIIKHKKDYVNTIEKKVGNFF